MEGSAKEVRTTTTTTTTAAAVTAAIIHAQQAGRQAKWEGFVFYWSGFSLSGEEGKRKGHLCGMDRHLSPISPMSGSSGKILNHP